MNQDEDRVAENSDPEGSRNFITIGLIVFAAIVVIGGLFLFTPWFDKAIKSSASSTEAAPSVAEKPRDPEDIKNEFMITCTPIALHKPKTEGASIYVKDFIKNPDKYHDQRVKMRAQIMKIEESGGKTLINAYISNNMDVGVIQFDGSVNAYDGDLLEVFGTVIGRVEGKNMMGAQLTWPAVQGKYIKVVRHEKG